MLAITPSSKAELRPVEPELILAGVYTGKSDHTDKGFLGQRKISRNACGDGAKKYEKVDKKCL